MKQENKKHSISLRGKIILESNEQNKIETILFENEIKLVQNNQLKDFY